MYQIKPGLRIGITSDVDPDPVFHLNADPDPAFHFKVEPDQFFALMRIRILFLVKVM
jgi:hypothetical protein